MKKTRLLLAAMILATVGGSFAAQAAPACNVTGSTGADPFGSCEVGGDVRCNGTEAPGKLFHAATPTDSADQGAQVCNDDGPVPIFGRVTVYRDGQTGNVIVSTDGDKDFVTTSWTRADVRPGASSCKVQLRRGASGSYYATGGGTSPSPPAGSTDPNAFNQCAG